MQRLSYAGGTSRALLSDRNLCSCGLLAVAKGASLAAPFLGSLVAPYGSILAACALAFVQRHAGTLLPKQACRGLIPSFAALFLFQVLAMPRWNTNLSKFTYSVVVTCCLAFVLLVPTY